MELILIESENFELTKVNFYYQGRMKIDNLTTKLMEEQIQQDKSLVLLKCRDFTISISDLEPRRTCSFWSRIRSEYKIIIYEISSLIIGKLMQIRLKLCGLSGQGAIELQKDRETRKEVRDVNRSKSGKGIQHQTDPGVEEINKETRFRKNLGKDTIVHAKAGAEPTITNN